METKRVSVVRLVEDLDAVLTVERNGQQVPSAGDGVKVRATVALPTESGNQSLADPLEFGGRVKVCGDPLMWHWGEFTNNCQRFKSNEFVGTNYAALLDEGMSWAQAQLQPLQDALKARAAALTAAE